MQYKKSPLGILSWIPFGILLGPPLYDIFPRAYNYPNDPITYNKMPTIEKKGDDSKNILINKVGVELDSIKTYYSKYKAFLNDKEAKNFSATEKEVVVENTEFSLLLNNILKEKGYIDTTKTALKNSYINNLFINLKKEYSNNDKGHQYLLCEKQSYLLSPIYSLCGFYYRLGDFRFLQKPCLYHYHYHQVGCFFL